ncbi:thermonuclease family protein [Candidatus Gottesmanbacteria bacterium]|nr:thermonuclease family protein [Candidatus Gottesmanbacteria bacterium]
MKRFVPFFFLFAAFLLGLSVDKAIHPSPQSPRSPISNLSPTPSPQPGYYKVSRVLDGDTIELEKGKRIRYMGIDAPELYERWGTVAYETNRDLVDGKLVRIEEDHPDRDLYGRTLAHVWIDDTLVSERLVDDGLAKVFLIKGEAKPKYLSRLQAAEERAKGATRGLWTPKP